MDRIWSEQEVREIVKDYFKMLTFEIRLNPYKKTNSKGGKGGHEFFFYGLEGC